MTASSAGWIEEANARARADQIMREQTRLQDGDELVPRQAGGPHDLLVRLEPGVAQRPALETQIFLASIAISLKRIADQLANLNR